MYHKSHPEHTLYQSCEMMFSESKDPKKRALDSKTGALTASVGAGHTSQMRAQDQCFFVLAVTLVRLPQKLIFAVLKIICT